MANFVLLHGAWHGPWCWHKVEPMLTSQGHKVICPTLPCQKHVGLSAYTQQVETIISNISQPIVLVAHSMSGLIACNLSNKALNKISRIIFIAAYATNENTSLIKIIDELSEPSIPEDCLETSGNIITTKPNIKNIFYNTCSKLDADSSFNMLVPQSFKALSSVIKVKSELLRVDTSYIVCSNDKAISKASQETMANQIGAQTVKIGSCHSPFLSQPDKIAALISNF